MKFDPESYTITIRKEEDDGEILYVGRVAEFPNISAFEDTFEAARALVLDSIQTLKNIADETHAEFPLPYPAPSDEFSGRVTLRLSKSLHAKVSRLAAQDDVSVNQYLVTAVATYVGEVDGISRVVSEAVNLLGSVVTHAWKSSQFLFNDVVTPAFLAKSSAFGGADYCLALTHGTQLTTGEILHG
jgi:predicted HicB family RNase H-like nuclease